MPRKLYGDILSPGVRTVLLAAKALNIDLDLISIDIYKEEHLTPEFTNMNPQQTIPTLDDNGFIIWESHSVAVYLIEKYGKEGFLYPQDPHIRANINRILHFDTGYLFLNYSQIATSIITGGSKVIREDLKQELLKNYDLLELFLEKFRYIADNELTVADFSIWTTLTNSSALVPIHENCYPKITAWIQELNKLPYKNLNNEGGEVAKNALYKLMKSQ